MKASVCLVINLRNLPNAESVSKMAIGGSGKKSRSLIGQISFYGFRAVCECCLHTCADSLHTFEGRNKNKRIVKLHNLKKHTDLLCSTTGSCYLLVGCLQEVRL